MHRDGQTLGFQLGLHHIYLILTVCFLGAIQQTNGLGIREPFGNHRSLCVQRCQVGGAGDVAANRTVKVTQIQCNTVLGNGSAQNGNVTGSGGSSLQCGGGVGHNQIHVVGDKLIDDGRTGVGIVLRILIVEFYHIRTQFVNNCLLKTCCCGIQCRVLYDLHNADFVFCGGGILAGAGGKGKTAAQTKGQCQ